MTVLTSNVINFIPLSIYRCSDLCPSWPLHSGKWRSTFPSSPGYMAPAPMVGSGITGAKMSFRKRQREMIKETR